MKIPLICEPSCHERSLPSLAKKKILVPGDITIGQLMVIVRTRLAVPSHQAIFLFMGGAIPSITMTIYQAADLYKDPDGFLYVEYTSENVFG